MKVFGIGLNKTGTTTLGACFKHLGLRHAPYERSLVYQWCEARDVDAVLRFAQRYESFEDWPWPLMARELAAHFPDARFVLTERASPEVWFESLCNHSRRAGTPRVRELVYGHADPAGHGPELMQRYRDHTAEVLEIFAAAPQRLLRVCWEVDASWAPLCGFLGRPIPEAPFPHANARPR